MPAFHASSTGVLLVCAACIACVACSVPKLAKEPSEVETPGEVEKTAKVGIEPPVADTLVSPPAGGTDSTEGKKEAYDAARVDPGILMHREPPVGTEMPTHRPPEDVDPKMTLPADSSLRRADPLERAELFEPEENVDP